MVSDFYTPDFFDPVPVSSVRYSFTGAIKSPRTVLKDGYISWPRSDHEPLDAAANVPRRAVHKGADVVDLSTQTTLGALLEEGMSVRSAVDRVTTTARRRSEERRAGREDREPDGAARGRGDGLAHGGKCCAQKSTA